MQVLGRPKVIAANGAESSVSIGKAVRIDGETISVGPKLTIRSTVGPEAASVSIELDADVAVADTEHSEQPSRTP